MNIGFAPFLPWPVLTALAVITLAIAALAVFRRMRGGWIRALAAFALLAALANPVLMQEDRDQLSTIVPVIVDRSLSQQTPERIKMTDEALDALKDRLAQFPRIEPRIVEVREPAESESPSTRLFSALSSTIADVPPARVGGAILLTDGEIHDIPGVNQALGFDAPIHGLITGKPDEFDRRIEVVRAPRFGIVNDEQQLVLRVIDDGKALAARVP